jgi:hypothetical protein
MTFSLAGLIGAVIGVVVGWINYAIVVGIAERKLRQLDRSKSAAERELFEGKIALMRRIILALDVVVFSVLGYMLGRAIGG